MKKKSLGLNAVLNIIKIAVGIIFPMIAFPYASRTLGADALGRISYGESVIVFVSLIAMLGTSAYAVREGASLRKDKAKLEKFASEVFSINLVAMIISYIVLFVILMLPTKLAGYKEIIFIQSIAILFTTIGVDWIYTIFEDYLLITIRTIIVQIISLVMLFIFVNSPEDYLNYAFITTVASAGVGLFNFFYVRKYCKLKFTWKMQLKKHLKPMTVLFSNDLAKKVYINSDVVMLGSMTADRNVGLYRMSAKIYEIVKNIVNSIVTVAIPRLAFSREHDKKRYNELNNTILSATILLAVPAAVGLGLLSGQIVRLVGGAEYAGSAVSLTLLAGGLVFAVLANFFSNAVLIVNRAEKYAFRATLIAAAVNFGLNLFLVPMMAQDGAALTTCIAEILVAVISFYHARKFVKFSGVGRNIIDCLIGCAGIVGICLLVCTFVESEVWQIVFSMFLSVIIYGLILLLVKNKLVYGGLEIVKNKLNGRKRKEEK